MELAPEAEYYGLDISPKLCEMARRNNPEAKIILGDVESPPFADHSFNFIFLTETLAHIADRNKVLSEINRLLVPGGYFFVTVPNRDWFRYSFYERMIKKLPGGTHYFRFKEIVALLKANHFLIVKYRGSDNLYYYDPYHKYEQVLAFFIPFLHKKMKRLLFKCIKI
jgi:ubiquinone/menaquinone biosynthesis C-methylase UbiE